MPDTAPQKVDLAHILDDALELPGTIAPYYSYFHPYSFTNMVYLYQQGAREIVGTYRAWQTVGRHVVRGSKAYEIIRPIIVEQPIPDDPDGETEPALIGFKPVRCIFTLSQTDGEALAPKETPGWHLTHALGNLGIRQVEFRSLDGNLQGYSRGAEIAVSPIAANPLKTTIHEMGHLVLGHTLPHHFEEYQTHRGVMEFQAEGVAYLVLNELGAMDEQAAQQSRGYIWHWLRSEQPPEQAVRQVLTAADRVLRAGRLGSVAVDNVVEGGP